MPTSDLLPDAGYSLVTFCEEVNVCNIGAAGSLPFLTSCFLVGAGGCSISRLSSASLASRILTYLFAFERFWVSHAVASSCAVLRAETRPDAGRFLELSMHGLRSESCEF